MIHILNRKLPPKAFPLWGNGKGAKKNGSRATRDPSVKYLL